MSTYDPLTEAAIEALKTAASIPIQKIVLERAEQIMVHGYDEDHDSTHGDGELAQAALAILAADCNAYQDTVVEAFSLWPPEWDSAMLDHMLAEKPYLDRLAVAAALIVAEMDRILVLIDGEIDKGPA